MKTLLLIARSLAAGGIGCTGTLWVLGRVSGDMVVWAIVAWAFMVVLDGWRAHRSGEMYDR